MPFFAYKEESRKNWGVTQLSEDKLSIDQINTGALLRIADSLERMEKPFADLIDENQRLRASRNNLLSTIDKLQRSVNAYKGIIKKRKS